MPANKPESTSEPRRSSRLSAAPPSKVENKDEGKKRPASKPESKTPATKKAKADDKPTPAAAPTSKAKAAPTSKSKPASKPASGPKKTPAPKAGTNGTAKGKKEDAIPEADESDGKDEKGDKEEENAAEEEKEAEAPAKAPAKKPASKAKQINEGDVLPEGLVLQNEEGEDVDVGKLAGERGVVVFLYPRANTPGCTTQACGFRDAFDAIKDLGYDVYGLSSDKPTAQKNWKTKQNMQYHLLCDPDFTLIKRLGAFVAPKNTKRSSFIFEKGSGKLVKANLGASPKTDPSICLDFIKAHHK